MLLIGLGVLVYRSWTCDDAFISFRYAQHLVDGHGLVFNPGETVEGYTNFLWTVWIALGLWLGAGAELWAHVWSAAAYLSCVGLLTWVYPRVSRREHLGAGGALVPVAALGAILHDDWTIYATGGLETSLFTLWLLAAYLTLLSSLPVHRRAALAGLLLGLATLTRPDGALVGVVAGVYLLLSSGERRWHAAALFAGVFAALWVPLQLWRLDFYGDFFPNTYYAKSAALSWWSQGLRYLGLYLLKYWVLLVVPLAAWLVTKRSMDTPSAPSTSSDSRRPTTLALAILAAYTLYIVKVGGGFMFARLLVPLTPLALIVLDRSLIPLARLRPRAYRIGVGIALVGLLATPFPVRHQEIRWGIANEWAFYTGGAAAKTDAEAETLASFFEGLPVRLAFLGGEARLVYRTGVPVAIECETGLTDRTIAHQTLHQRGRIGHEKHAPIDYVIDERRAHFAFHPFVTNVLPLDEAIPDYSIALGAVTGRILHWDAELLSELRRRGAVFDDLPRVLDRYLETVDGRSRLVVAREYERYRRFYFQFVDDPTRERRFQDRLLRPESE